MNKLMYSAVLLLVFCMQTLSVQHSLEHFSQQEAVECEFCSLTKVGDEDAISPSKSHFHPANTPSLPLTESIALEIVYDAPTDIRGPPRNTLC